MTGSITMESLAGFGIANIEVVVAEQASVNQLEIVYAAPQLQELVFPDTNGKYSSITTNIR